MSECVKLKWYPKGCLRFKVNRFCGLLRCSIFVGSTLEASIHPKVSNNLIFKGALKRSNPDFWKNVSILSDLCFTLCISRNNEEQIMGHNFTGSHRFNKHRMQAAQLGLAPISFNLSSKGWKMCAIVAWGLDRNYPALSGICQHGSGTNSEDDKSVIVVQSPITRCSAQHGCISGLEKFHRLYNVHGTDRSMAPRSLQPSWSCRIVSSSSSSPFQIRSIQLPRCWSSLFFRKRPRHKGLCRLS